MARYSNDFLGVPGQPGGARGMDPNHRDGYRGMRMQSGPHQAAYGWHRWTHEGDFETSGGFRGHHGGGPSHGERFINSRPRYDQDLRGGGGVHDGRYDTGYLRDFNADSIRFREEGRSRGGREGRATPGTSPGQRARYDGGFRRGPIDRGSNQGGYSESWSWGPMRGSR